MTEQIVEDTEASSTAVQAPQSRYFIDLDGYAQKNRSQEIVLRERMCQESRARLGEQVRSREPVQDSGKGKVRFNTKSGRYGEDPVALIAECCATKPEFKDPRLPLKEVLFRVLLANRNQPMTVEELRAAASEWTGFEYGGGITDEAVQQIAEADEHYGFALAE